MAGFPKGVGIGVSWEGNVELKLMQGGVNYTFEFEPEDGYNIGLALVAISHEATMKIRERVNKNDDTQFQVSEVRNGKDAYAGRDDQSRVSQSTASSNPLRGERM